MRRMEHNKRDDNKSCKCRRPCGLSKDNSFWARGARGCVAGIFSSSSWNAARRYPEILTVFTKSSRELLVGFRIETKFLLESIPQTTFKAESFPTVRAIVYPRPTHNQSADSAGRYRICKDEIPLFYLGLLEVRRRYGMLRDR